MLFLEAITYSSPIARIPLYMQSTSFKIVAQCIMAKGAQLFPAWID
jgi:hypothetical protein